MSIISEKGEGRSDDGRPSVEFVEKKSDISDVRLVDIPAFLIFWLLAIIVFLQFFTRYVLNDSLAWTEEIARYVLILVAFTGAVIVSRKGTHIFLEFFYRYIPPKLAKALAITAETLNLLFWGGMAWVGVELALKTKTKMASVEIPKSLLYWSVTICLVGMAIYSAFWLIKKIRQKPSEILLEIEDHTIRE